ncbi:MAG TPA: radical SAM protein [Candidatus Elarobacter sp.]
MLIAPVSLSILTTRRCSAACDHCSVGAGPRERLAIPVERIHRLIDEAAEIPSIRRICFTGGECFTLGEALDALVGRAAAAGFTTRVITNGYWAVDAGAATERVRKLAAVGLDEMMLSTGTFHQRFVPVERVIHGARAAAAAGIATRISVETCDQSDFDERALEAAVADLIASRRLRIGRDPWIPDAGGRGTTALSHRRFLSETGPHGYGSCAQILNVISVTPAQDVVACCGFPSEQLPELRIGSIAERRLQDVLASAPDELMKMWLHVAGPAGIAAFVARYIPGYSLPPSASICQSCVTLQRDGRAMAVVRAHAAEIAPQIALQFATALIAT